MIEIAVYQKKLNQNKSENKQFKEDKIDWSFDGAHTQTQTTKSLITNQFSFCFYIINNIEKLGSGNGYKKI